MALLFDPAPKLADFSRSDAEHAVISEMIAREVCLKIDGHMSSLACRRRRFDGLVLTDKFAALKLARKL